MTEYEHDPLESARPELARRDAPDTIRPDAEEEPHRKLPDDDDPTDPPSSVPR